MRIETRRISASTPLYDHAGELLGQCGREKTHEMMSRPDVLVIASKKRILGLRFLGPDPAHLLSGSRHRRPAGTPHQQENYWNPRGVWHIDRIPEKWKVHFMGVVEDCSAAEQAARVE